jgi:hypothetical protein
MKMQSPINIIAAALAVALTLAQTVTSQLITETVAQTTTPPPPQQYRQAKHSAVYTTTVTNPKPDIVTAVVVITLISPAEDERYPTQGAPMFGTAISRFSASAASSSAWDETADIYWTLSGNVPLGYDTTYPPLPLGLTTSLSTVVTWTDYRVTTYRNLFFGYGRTEWWTTARVTFVEGVGPVYPATIIRTGYTDWRVRQTGGNEAVGFNHSNSATMSYWRTTTLVQVPAMPTALPSTEGGG